MRRIRSLFGGLRERARSLGTVQFDNTVPMAVALGGLFLAGGTIGAASLLLPHPAEFDDWALWSNVGVALVAGIGLLGLRNHVSAWMIQVAVLVGTVVITRAVYYGMNPDGFYVLWYLWVGVYSFFFFGRAWGIVHLAVIGICYSWILSQLPEQTQVASWFVTMSAIAVVGGLVDYLARRLRRETASADARAHNLEAVGEVARQLATQSDPRAVGWAICTATLRATHAAAAVLWRTNPAGNELVAAAAAGAQVERIGLPFITPGSGAIQAFTAGQPRFEDISRSGATQELAPRFEAGAALWHPVSANEKVVGVLAVYWKEPRAGVSGEVRQAVQLLALEAAIAIERGELLGRLETAARTDDLTGLHNRRAWSTELGREMKRAERQHRPLCVAVLDLDRFKQYNDKKGHQSGDRFLKRVAGIWSQALRTTDILARHGGEEFALAMPDTDLDAAKHMLERMRDAVPEQETCSAGVCLWDGSESAESLLDRADTALYAAKAAGRDQVIAS